MLPLCQLGLDPLINTVPVNRLPPAFGMAFMMTPFVPVSAVWPDNCTSTCSNNSGDRLMFVRFEL